MNETIRKETGIEKWQSLIIAMLAIVIFMQASREILLDRGIALVVVGIIGSMLIFALLAGLLSNYISNLSILVFSGLISGVGRILLSMPDNTENFDIYNVGLYFCLSSFAPIFISLLGLINLERADAYSKLGDSNEGRAQRIFKIDNSSMAVTGMLAGLVYHWMLRAVGYAEDVLVNVFLGMILIIITLMLLYKKIIRIQIHNGKLKQLFLRRTDRLQILKAEEHPGKKYKFVLIGIPCFIILTVSMSFPELYAFMSGVSYQTVLVFLSSGIFLAVIIHVLSNNLPGLEEKINFLLPVFSLITTCVFGLISFYPSGVWLYNFIYLIAAFTVSYIFMRVIHSFISTGSNDTEKILMVFIVLSVFGIQAVKLGTIERYLPYIESLVCLGFAIPSLWIWIRKLQARRDK